MDSYFELKAIPDPELLQSEVLAQLMQVTHGLIPAYEGRVGVSFPGYGQSRTLGGILRLHGNDTDLQKLQSQLNEQPVIRSYALVTDVGAIPKRIRDYGVFKRQHIKGRSDIRRLINRHKKRGTWTEELETAITHKYSEETICPHLKLKSSSTGQASFLLFVKREIQKKPSENREFGSYGLSKVGSTIPLF
jgi:CRISPR-associated endonuclease Csy4